MVKFLASQGADVNARGVIRQWERKVITEPRPKDMNKGGFTPLLYAAREGCVECARHLIAAGADPDLEDPDRVTPLNMALLNLHFEFAAVPDQSRRRSRQVGSLRPVAGLHGRRRQHAADERQRRDGRDPERGCAHGARRRPAAARGTAPIRIFSSSGVRRIAMCRRIAAATRSWRRAPRRCCARRAAGDAPFVELLLKHKALVDLPSKEGVTPLMAAAGVEFGTRVTRGRNRTNEGVLATMQLLLDAGARHQRQDGDRAAARGDRRRGSTRGGGCRTRRTRQSGAERAGRSAPDRAARRSRERVSPPFVKFLAENGADLQPKMPTAERPLDLARGSGRAGGRGPAAEPFPETAALLESLMKAKGLATSSAK